MINLVAACRKFLHHRRKLFLHCATQTAVGQLIELTSLYAVLVTANAAAAQQFTVNTEFAKLVDDDCNAATLRMGEQVAQQCGLAAAKKTSDDGGGDFSGLHH